MQQRKHTIQSILAMLMILCMLGGILPAAAEAKRKMNWIK